jgi:hypothetical protein
MPTATPTKSAAARAAAAKKSSALPSRRQAGRPVRPPAFQEPLVPAVESDRPQDHNGIPVVREELVGNLPTGAKMKISKLHLSDGTLAFACRDCLFSADSRAEVMQHRNQQHGSRYGKKTPKLVFAKDKDVHDVVLPPRTDGPAPGNIMEMTMAEVLALMPSIGALGDLVEEATHRAELAEVELAERRRHDRENEQKIAAYDSMREELVDRRVAMKGFSSYDDMKNELRELRAWKQKITARLKPLGFVLAEEDEEQE